MDRGRFRSLQWLSPEAQWGGPPPAGADPSAPLPPATAQGEATEPGSSERLLVELVRRTGVPRAPGHEHLTARQEAAYLLQAAAEVEHQFGVQYLYVMWSLDGDPHGWAEVLHQLAMEEMGHLITVQNLLALIGESPYLGRERIPPPAPLPIDLILEPFGPEFVARSLVAESPLNADLPEELSPLRQEREHVGVLYMMLYWLFQPGDDPAGPWSLPPDLGFPPGRHLAAAEFIHPEEARRRVHRVTDWSLGSEPPETSPPGAGGGRRPPFFRVLPSGPFDSPEAIRARALDALYDKAALGEGPTSGAGDERRSHHRLLREIYDALKRGEVAPARDIPIAPHTRPWLPGGDPEAEPGLITDGAALQWARLFNLRYHMLLLSILQSAVTPLEEEAVRRTLARDWAVCGEMVAGLGAPTGQLLGLPLKASRPEGPRAAPPFELPDPPLPTDARPEDAPTLWRLQLDLIDRAAPLIETLMPATAALREFDARRRAFIQEQLARG